MYEPNSIDAMLSRIVANQEAQDGVTQQYREEVRSHLLALQKSMDEGLAKIDGRVIVLESDSKMVKGGAAAIAAVCSVGFALWQAVEHFVRK